MNESPTFLERANNWVKNSVTLRLATIGILILLLLIPVSMVEGVIYEREVRLKEAVAEVSAKWGEEQTLSGPVLTVPYRSYTKVFEDSKSEKFKLVESRGYAHFLPEKLVVNGEVFPEVRYRGIYEVIVYNSKLKMSGSFENISFKNWKINEEDVLWEDAVLSLGLSDLRSIQQNVNIRWDDTTLNFNPGLLNKDVIAKGISTKPFAGAGNIKPKYNFQLDINFNGSSGLHFTPLGKITQVAMRSKWNNPSFTGSFLPDTRAISDSGFNASWEVLHLNRAYPQQFLGAAENIDESVFGIELIVPVDEYQKSMRSAKYAVMFITLTFLVFFFVQILNGVRIHPIQYIIVGLALCVFYTLLIALSEHIHFNISYLISSVSIITMITLYAKSIFNNRKLTGIIFLILVMLYLFIFTIIQMQDYALLIGSIGLFLVLAAVMYLSRKVDWYAVRTKGIVEDQK